MFCKLYHGLLFPNFSLTFFCFLFQEPASVRLFVMYIVVVSNIDKHAINVNMLSYLSYKCSSLLTIPYLHCIINEQVN